MACFFTLRDSFQINIEALFRIFGCFSKNCISALFIIQHPVLNERPPLSYQKYLGTKSTQAPWVLLKSNHSGKLCTFLETYKENLSDNQKLLEYAISSYTLVITNFNSGVLLLGEIRCLSVSMFPAFFLQPRSHSVPDKTDPVSSEFPRQHGCRGHSLLFFCLLSCIGIQPFSPAMRASLEVLL